MVASTLQHAPRVRVACDHFHFTGCAGLPRSTSMDVYIHLASCKLHFLGDYLLQRLVDHSGGVDGVPECISV